MGTQAASSWFTHRGHHGTRLAVPRCWPARLWRFALSVIVLHPARACTWASAGRQLRRRVGLVPSLCYCLLELGPRAARIQLPVQHPNPPPPIPLATSFSRPVLHPHAPLPIQHVSAIRPFRRRLSVAHVRPRGRPRGRVYGFCHRDAQDDGTPGPCRQGAV